MRNFLLLLTIFTFIFSFAQAHGSEKIIVLVPGFFNFPGHDSPIGLQYFSQTIVRTIQDEGYETEIFDNLNPVGTVSDNGHRVLKNLQDLVATNPQAEIAILAHSAGGLYVAQALTLDPSLPVKAVVTVSTPYLGSELIELLDKLPGFFQMTQLFNLLSLQEFQPRRMNAIWDSLRIPRSVHWATVASEQPACRLLSCRLAENQSWLLSTAWRFTRKTGDGVVSVESALGKPSQGVEPWADLTIPLEHWEAVLDSNYFAFLGVSNTRWIDEQQRESYLKILNRLNF